MPERKMFTLYGKEYEFVSPPEFTLGEMNECERVFGATFNDDELNSRRISSILYVSIKRVDATVTPKVVEDMGPAELEEFNRSAKRWAKDDDADPPTPGQSLSEPVSLEPVSDVEPAASTPELDRKRSGPLVSPSGLVLDPVTYMSSQSDN